MKEKPDRPERARATTVRQQKLHPNRGRSWRCFKRDRGATLHDMMAATGWQRHSVRGFLAGALKKQHGLTARSEKTEQGRVYRAVTVA